MVVVVPIFCMGFKYLSSKFPYRSFKIFSLNPARGFLCCLPDKSLIFLSGFFDNYGRISDAFNGFSRFLLFLLGFLTTICTPVGFNY